MPKHSHTKVEARLGHTQVKLGPTLNWMGFNLKSGWVQVKLG